MRTKLCTIITLLFLLCSTAFGQIRNIRGIVYNASTKEAISDINITVRGTSIVSKTDVNGEFSIDVPDTLVNIEFRGFAGMQLSEIKIVEQNVFHLFLSPDEEGLFNLSLEQLMEIPITSASKFEETVNETPATVFIITSEDIRRRGYLTMIELLEDLPGMDVTNSHGEVNVLTYGRGNRTPSMNERLMLLVDGVEHNILYSQQMMIAQDFPLGVIERVEILYGPSAAVYGPNAFSGVVNVITKNANSINDYDNISILTSAGSFNTQLADVAYQAKHGELGVMLSYRRFRSDRFDMSDRKGYFAEGTIIGNPEIWGPYAKEYDKFENKADNFSIFSKVNYKNIEIGYNHLETMQGNGASYPYDKTLPTSEWRMSRDIIYARYSKDVSDKFNFSVLATFQTGGTGPDAVWAQGWNDSTNWNSQRTVEMLTWKYISERWAIFEDFVFRPKDYLTISGGLKYASTIYQKSYDFGRSDQTIWIPGQEWEEVENIYPKPYSEWHTAGNVFNDYEWGVYGQIKYTLKNINLLFGARYDDNSIYGNVFNPRVGLTFALLKDLWFKTSYGKAFQAPSPRNLYGSWGGLIVNASLSPEKISTYDGSFIYTHKNLRADITAFYNIVINSVLQGENLPEKNMTGIELKTDYLLSNIESSVINQFRLHLNYSFINAKYVSDRFDKNTNRKSNLIGDIAPHKLNIVLTSTFFDRIGLFVRGNFVSERTTIVSNPVEKVDAYFTLNAGIQIEKLFGYKGATFFVNGYNLLDEDYYHPGWDAASAGEDLSKPSGGWYCSRMPQAPINVMTGIRLDF